MLAVAGFCTDINDDYVLYPDLTSLDLLLLLIQMCKDSVTYL